MLRFRRLKYHSVKALSSIQSSNLVCHRYDTWSVSESSNHVALFQLIIPPFARGKTPSASSGFPCRFISSVCSFTTMVGPTLIQARDPTKLSLEIQNAMDEHRLDDAWKFYELHMHMEGFPRKSVVNKMLTSFSESLDPHLLEKAYGLVERAFEEGKQTLLEKETLIFLSLALSRCKLPEPASVLVRKLVSIELYPPVTAWSAIIAYMSQTGPGAYLAAELVLEIGSLFLDNRVDPRKKSNAPLLGVKPNALVLNLASVSCLLSGFASKAEQIIDMIPRIGVKSDADLLIIMAHVYERNGRREELKKLRRYIDEAHSLREAQFREYYNCLLSCYLKFGDLGSASHMILEMFRKARLARDSLAIATLKFEPQKDTKKSLIEASDKTGLDDLDKMTTDVTDFMGFEDFLRDRKFVRLETWAKEMLGHLSVKLQNQVELLTTEHGILQPTKKAYVKLVKEYLEARKTKELAEFLIETEKQDSPASADDSALVHVINSCISLGLLDQAHDLLDELRFRGIKTSSSVYSSLVKAYCKEDRTREANSLVREVSNAGIQLDASCYEALIRSRVLQNDTVEALRLFKEMKEAKIPKGGHLEFETLVKESSKDRQAGLMDELVREISKEQRGDGGVHEWNNIIHFFCKKRLMKDAEKALKKMRSLGYTPNAKTFHSMVTAYGAIGGKYIEVAELWGEMKSIKNATVMKFDQELLDSVLYTFVRGGFFIRANEVVETMENANMFVDKYKYRTIFLKYHKTSYKGKEPKVQTENQLKRREAALAFKKWVGLY